MCWKMVVFTASAFWYDSLDWLCTHLQCCNICVLAWVIAIYMGLDIFILQGQRDVTYEDSYQDCSTFQHSAIWYNRFRIRVVFIPKRLGFNPTHPFFNRPWKASWVPISIAEKIVYPAHREREGDRGTESIEQLTANAYLIKWVAKHWETNN